VKIQLCRCLISPPCKIAQEENAPHLVSLGVAYMLWDSLYSSPINWVFGIHLDGCLQDKLTLALYSNHLQIYLGIFLIVTKIIITRTLKAKLKQGYF